MHKRFASIAEVADLLGVSVSTVRRRIAGDEIRVHRVGRQIRIERSDLNRFIEGCRYTNADHVVIGDEAEYDADKKQ
jgi:excisionase family DNA binding protein